MAPTMTLAESRRRAEEAFVMREVGCMSWSKIRDQLGFASIGATQLAVKRYCQRNPLPNAKDAAAGIVTRKRHVLGIAMSSLAKAHKAGDHRTVAQLVDAITRADAEMARLYGLGSERVDVNVRVHQSPAEIIAAATADLLAVVDAEVVSETREITR